MIYELNFHYGNCTECADANGCAQCQSRLEETLYGIEGIDGVEIRISDAHISIETESLTSDALKELFEENGISAEFIN